MGPKNFDPKLLGWLTWVGTILACLVSSEHYRKADWVDLERYAEKIGALTKTDLRVSRTGEEDDDIGTERKPMRRGTVADDDDEDWD
jgi:hypothetical protein